MKSDPVPNKAKTKWLSCLWMLYAILSYSTRFWIQDEVFTPFIMAFKYLALPAVAISYTIYFRFVPEWRHERVLKRKLEPLGIALVVVFVAFGYINIVNAFIPPSQKVVVEGRVVDMSSTGVARTITVQTDQDKRIRLRVTREEYRNTSLGGTFRKKMDRGCLGLLYKIGNLF